MFAPGLVLHLNCEVSSAGMPAPTDPLLLVLHSQRRLVTAMSNAGIIFTVFSEPYLMSEYGVEYMNDSPVKLMEQLIHGERKNPEQQVLSSLPCSAFPTSQCLM